MAVIAAIFGLLIGSFLNVCIYRIPREESIVFPPSHCMVCEHGLGVLDLIPVASFCILGGKCRYCGAKISKQYPVVELANGLLYGVIFYQFGFGVDAIVYSIFASVMVVLTVIDLREMILPTKVILFGGIVALVGSIIRVYMYSDFSYLWSALLGGAIGYAFLAIPFYISIYGFKKEGMGFGDVRYLAMIGLFTSVKLVILIAFIAAILGAIYGGIQLAIKKTSLPFPFGPFLSVGAITSILYGEQLLDWYFNLLV